MNAELQKEAKELINDLFERGYFPSQIIQLIADIRGREILSISKDMAETMYDILSEVNIYEAVVSLYDSEDNELEKSSVLGCNEKEINKMIDEIVGKTNGISYGKISKYISIV